MPRLIATWNPARGVWETIQPSLLCGHLVPFSATWPTSGSMLSGRVRAPLTSAPPTAGSGSGSSPGRLLATPTRLDLLPTPEAKLADSGPDWGRAGRQVDNAGGGGDDLTTAVHRLLPTPTARDAKGRSARAPIRASGRVRTDADLLLPDVVALMPTPDASLFNDGQTVDAYRARKERERAKGYNGNGGGTPLAMAVRLLPTPTASDAKASGGSTRSDVTVRTSLGAATNPRFADGKQSSGDQHPHPSSEEPAALFD